VTDRLSGAVRPTGRAVTAQGHPRRIFATAIEEATVVWSCLVALGGPSHEEAYGMLAAMAERATRQGRAGRVAS
jgi:hypothetical protein